MLLEDLVASGKWPKEWVLTYPKGYRLECRIVSTRYIQKLNASTGGGVASDAMSFTFGEVVMGKKLPDKTSRAYFDKKMDVWRFAHCYFHEAHHTFIEWTGDIHADLMLMIKGMEDA